MKKVYYELRYIKFQTYSIGIYMDGEMFKNIFTKILLA